VVIYGGLSVVWAIDSAKREDGCTDVPAAVNAEDAIDRLFVLTLLI